MPFASEFRSWAHEHGRYNRTPQDARGEVGGLRPVKVVREFKTSIAGDTHLHQAGELRIAGEICHQTKTCLLLGLNPRYYWGAPVLLGDERVPLRDLKFMRYSAFTQN